MAGERDETEVARFAERFAGVMADAGLPRMPARVFAALLTSETGRRTSAELAGQLQASPAAISGAVRFLLQLRYVTREREPGTRRDRYALHDDIWFEATAQRDAALARMVAVLREGEPIVGEGTEANRRIAEAADFMQFIIDEMPRLLERWHAHRRT